MHITDRIARRKQPLVSIEITPPEEGRSISELFGSVYQLLPLKPTLIAATYHHQRVVGEGIGARRATRKTRLKD